MKQKSPSIIAFLLLLFILLFNINSLHAKIGLAPQLDNGNNLALCDTYDTINVTVCDSYTWIENGLTYTTSGTYTSTSFISVGCIHYATLNLIVNYNSSSISTISACDSYTWNGTTYTTSGIYTFTSVNASGCVHTDSLNLGINSSIHITINDTICGSSYTWNVNNTIYTSSGTYNYISTGSNGCQITYTLNLLLVAAPPPTYLAINSFPDIIVDSVTFNSGITDPCYSVYRVCWPLTNDLITSSISSPYPIGGGYDFHVFKLRNTCLNCYIKDSFLVNSESTKETHIYKTRCKVYSDNYNETGIYIDTFQDSNNLDSIVVLHLNIVDGSHSTITVIACDSYTWSLNGLTFTASGIYTQTSLNSNSCLNRDTLILTINQSTSTTTNLTACDLYTWPINGQTYTTSGLYTFTSLNSAGCVNFDSLNLTINATTVSSFCGVEACESYTWAQNGITYTASGSYYWVGQNPSGCPDVYTLCLTINQPSTSTETISACNSYTWSNGVTYTTSGQYTYTYINVFGCASTSLLNLNLSSGIVIAANAMLRGAYDASTGLMKDSLRRLTHFQTPGTLPSDGQFSVGAPVNVIPLTRIAFASELPCANDNEISIGGGNAATAAAILAVSGNNAIVDWVLIEVRDGSNYNTVVNTKNALIQRDGDVVSCIDGISPLSFSCVCPGNYYISIKHRNHLGVMTANTVALSSTSTTVPFSDATIPVWAKLSIANSPRSTAIGSVATLWGGDANTNKNAKYNGLSNDKEVILTDIGGTGNSNIILYQTYKKSDLNMDGKVHYNNADNDKNWLLNFVYNLSIPFTPNHVILQHTPN